MRHTYRGALLPFLIITLAAAVVTTGCLSKAKRVTDTTALDTETVVMKDAAVTTNVSLHKDWSEVVNGMLKAHVILRNNRNSTVKLEIKTIFTDDQGIPIESAVDTWHPVMIMSNEDYHYEKLCPVVGAASYQFLIRTSGSS
jgi:uncharacterized protein YcfL